MLRALITLLRQAGAYREDDTDRDGAFSYKSETHAAGVGAGLGFAATATGQTRLLGLVVSMALYGRRGETTLDQTIVADVQAEPHYALGGLLLGALVGRFAL